MKHYFGLHLADRAFHRELVAQIAKDNLHALIGTQNISPGHIPLQREEFVPADFRETLQ
jgi:hypothetical protein